jgi:cell division protein FtsL
MREIVVSRHINVEELLQTECDTILNDISQLETEKRAIQQAIDENKTKLKQAQAKISEERRRKRLPQGARNSEMSEDFDNAVFP